MKFVLHLFSFFLFQSVCAQRADSTNPVFYNENNRINPRTVYPALDVNLKAFKNILIVVDGKISITDIKTLQKSNKREYILIHHSEDYNNREVINEVYVYRSRKKKR